MSSTMESVFRLSVIVNMIDNLSRPIVSVRKDIDTTVSSLEKMQTTALNMAKQGSVMTGLGNTITNAIMQPVNATMETKRAIGELSSLGLQDLDLLENAATQFSDIWAGTTKSQFITAAYDIKSGIASLADDGVAKYTEFSGITATATKATIAEMTSLFATGYGIYKDYYSNLSDIEFGEMFSAGIADSVRAFKTSGSGMAQSIQALGAAATNAGVPMEEQLSILGMLQATMSGSEAGTKYSAFLRGAAKAGDELGLSFVDANNNLRSMPEILGILRGRFGETLDAAEKMELTKAFGTEEAIKLIDLLYGKTGDLQNNILMLYGSMGQGIGLTTEMANKINATDPSKFDIIRQQVHNISEILGNALSPAVMDIINSGGQILGVIGTWAQNNQQLAGTIMKIILAFGILVSACGFIAISFGSIGFVVSKAITIFKLLGGSISYIKSGFQTLQIVALYAGDGLRKFGGFGLKALGAVKNLALGIFNFGKQAIFAGIKAIPGLISSVWGFTTALLANPVTWIVIGVIALIAALYLLWKNFDKVKAFLSGAFSSAINSAIGAFGWFKETIASVPNSILALIAAFVPFIGIPLLIFKNWDSIKQFFSDTWNGIQASFDNFMTGFLPNMLNSGKKLLTTFTEGIKSVINNPVEAFKGGLQKIRNMLPFSDAKVGPLSKLTLSGKRIFETITVGMKATKLMPQQIFEDAMNFGKNFSGDSSGTQSPDTGAKKSGSILQVIREATRSESSTTDKTTVKSNGKKIIVQKVEYHFDIKDLKDITLMKRLLEDMEDIDNSIPDDDDLVTA